MRNHGFTLVELSIVLVILGLLVGGVLSGQSLIRAAELRSVITQYNSFTTAAQTFRDKYFNLPGDMTNATAYWGLASACPGDYTRVSSGTSTCNGDGNGLINWNGANESFTFWQHLANAGLIEGSYSGVEDGSAGNFWTITTAKNSPHGRLGSSLWYVAEWGVILGQPYAFDGSYRHVLLFGGAKLNNPPTTPIFKPEEAYNIDTKIDDGKPATGNIKMYGDFTLCTDAPNSAALTASYLVSSTALSCDLYFQNVF